MLRALLPTLAFSIWSTDAFRHPFNALHHSGPASPYFDAPPQPGIPYETPAGCTVDQAAYWVRHGGRYPEPGSFGGWQSLFSKLQNATFTAHNSLAFLPSWTPAVDNLPFEPLFLTGTGAGESFDLGVELRKRYGFTAGGDNMTVWSAGQQRVVDTAYHFINGYMGRGNFLADPTKNRGHIVVLPDNANTTFANALTPGSGCPKLSSGDNSSLANAYRASYQPQIAERLNRMLDGLTLNATDIGPMMDLCGFQTEISGIEQFCDIFTEQEWHKYEHAHDINYYWGSGPGNPFSAAVGMPSVKAVRDLFMVGPNKTVEGGSFTPPSLMMGMTHDNDLPPIVSALGLWNESEVSPTTINPRQLFRSSHLVSFRGYIALERLSCDLPLNATVGHNANVIVPTPGKSSNTTQFVRVLISKAPVPIPGCDSGPGFSCPLADFSKYINERAEIAGDYVEVCGLQNVTNATSVSSFRTTIPPNSTYLTPLPQAVLL